MLGNVCCQWQNQKVVLSQHPGKELGNRYKNLKLPSSLSLSFGLGRMTRRNKEKLRKKLKCLGLLLTTNIRKHFTAQ